MKRNILNSPRLLKLKKKRQKIFINKIFLFIIALLAVFTGLSYLSGLKQLNIAEVKINGNKSIDSEMAKIIAQKEITGNYLWFFPKTNILFYPKNNIKNELQNEFKRLKDAVFSIKDGKTLEISLIEREASYMWCNTALPESDPAGQKCYFMDENGFIFDEAAYFSGEVYFKFYGKISAEENNPSSGSYFAKENFYKFILFKKVLEDMRLKPVALYQEDNGDIKFFLSEENSLSIGPEIILKINSDFQKVAENLETALSTEPLQSNFKNKYSLLQYIDLRFGNKVYYKFRQ